MRDNKLIKTADFWLVLFLMALAVMIVIAEWLRWFRLSAVIAGEPVHHWFSWSGAIFIGLYTPVYAILKRRYPPRRNVLSRIHIFGNLLSIAAIALHFTHQLTRPAKTFPELGTGAALITVLAVLVITGSALRFQLTGQPYKTWRWIHSGVVLSFYFIVIIHILHGAGVPGF